MHYFLLQLAFGTINCAFAQLIVLCFVGRVLEWLVGCWT
jgi:hypothetical protein